MIQQRVTLTVAGSAPVAADILVYLNNIFIGRTTADERALWNLKPHDSRPRRQTHAAR